MRERKYIKLRSDMYDDTKFKIIDTMEDRDTINYIWTRILTLCGKINNEYGYLLVSKDIPYTVEILSIEFNRSKEQIEHALSVFIDLNMISKDDDNVIQVCNFNKHQVFRKKKEPIKKGEVECNTKKDISTVLSSAKNNEVENDKNTGEGSSNSVLGTCYDTDKEKNKMIAKNINKTSTRIMKFINEDLEETAVDNIKNKAKINEELKSGIG